MEDAAVSANKIEPVRRVNLASQVMDSVKNYITRNDLRPGDRLPREKDLTARLGVSRNILREALKALEAVGVIEIKVGDGMYVSDFDYSTMVSHISFALARKHQEMGHFIQARLVIELGALDLVMENLDDTSMRRLEQSAAAIEAAGSLEETVELDLQFHKDVLSVARNPILMEFGSFLGQFFAEAKRRAGSEAKQRAMKGHGELLDALRARDLDRARDSMKRHIMSWKSSF